MALGLLSLSFDPDRLLADLRGDAGGALGRFRALPFLQSLGIYVSIALQLASFFI